MIRNYSKFISDLVKAITSDNSDFTWLQFGELMKNSVILVLFVLFMTVGLSSISYFGPHAIYKKTIGTQVSKMELLYDEGNWGSYGVQRKKVLKWKIVYFFLFGVVYIPLVLPILLMVVNVLF